MKYRAIAVWAALVAVGGAFVPSAGATVVTTPSATGRRGAVVQQLPMTAHAAVSAVQAGSGKQITLDNGKRLTLTESQYSTWRDLRAKNARRSVTPDSVGIPCGYEFLMFEAIGGSKGRILTTWKLDTGLSSVEFLWTVHVVENSGVYAKVWESDSYAAYSWSSGYYDRTYPKGLAVASIDAQAGVSWVLLDTGSFCYADNTSQAADIY